MTDAELTLIATRIMDRAERDKALHLSSIVEELKAGLAIVKRNDERTSSAAIMQAMQSPKWTDVFTKEQPIALADYVRSARARWLNEGSKT